MVSLKHWAYIFLGWGIVSVLFVSWAINNRIESFHAVFKNETYSLHRLVSQRADQHDAHLTALSTIASTNETPLYEMMGSLVETISNFYSRIVHVDLITLDVQNSTSLFTTRSTPLDLPWRNKISRVASNSTGKLAIEPIDGGYLLIKRSPNTRAARYGLALSIDVVKLLDSDLLIAPNFTFELSTNEGAILFTKNNISSESFFDTTFKFKETLGSSSQPLVFKMTKQIAINQIIPWAVITSFLFISVAALLGYKAYAKQRGQAKLAKEHAQLKDHEARIAHASRVNGLGEMASGIAHEITQPLTAILSQSQAGEHLLKRRSDDRESITNILKNITVQAKRAGDILARLRKWSSPTENGRETVDLNSVVTGIQSLMKPDMDEREINTELTLSTITPLIDVDAVQIEQVLFNLARNSADAMEGQSDRLLKIITEIDGDYAVIRVVDTGAGISKETLARSNQPFFTTKENGLGLGLSLCESIVERFDGTIELASNSNIGATAIVKFRRKMEDNS